MGDKFVARLCHLRLGVRTQPASIGRRTKANHSGSDGVGEGIRRMIRHSSSGPSALLKTTVITVLLLGAAAAVAQPPGVQSEHASQTERAPPGPDLSQVGFHDLICRPNGSEDGFDCADEATPAKMVPIPSQVSRPRLRDEPVSG